MAQHADTERVDERVAGVRRVEDRLPADVGEAQAVAVAADPGHDPRQHPVGVVGVERPEAQRVHHRDRPGTHGQDVADDAAHPGRGSLVGLDVRRVVVRLDLEGHGVALTDVEDTGVLTDAGEHLADRRLLHDLGELLEVHLGGLVGAVLAPHHRVHRQLRARSGGDRGSRGSGGTRPPSGPARPRAAGGRDPRRRRRRCRGAAARRQSTGDSPADLGRLVGADGSDRTPGTRDRSRRRHAGDLGVERQER